LGSRCEEAGFDLVVNFACHDLAALGTANLQNTSAGCVPHQRLNIPAALRRVAEIVELVIIESSDSPPKRHDAHALHPTLALLLEAVLRHSVP